MVGRMKQRSAHVSQVEPLESLTPEMSQTHQSNRLLAVDSQAFRFEVQHTFLALEPVDAQLDLVNVF